MSLATTKAEFFSLEFLLVDLKRRGVLSNYTVQNVVRMGNALPSDKRRGFVSQVRRREQRLKEIYEAARAY